MSRYNPVIYNELVRIGSVMMDMRKELEREFTIISCGLDNTIELLERLITGGDIAIN